MPSVANGRALCQSGARTSSEALAGQLRRVATIEKGCAHGYRRSWRSGASASTRRRGSPIPACMKCCASVGLEPSRPARRASSATRGDRPLGEQSGEGKKTPTRMLDCFQDESGSASCPREATWAPRGRPGAHHHFNWKRLSMSAAVGYAPDAPMRGCMDTTVLQRES